MNIKSHTVITGDFNFVHKGGDRFHFDRNPPTWATTGDSESKHWDSLFSGDHSTNEIYQSRMTFHNSRWTSRIDRAYSSPANGRLAALQARDFVSERVSWADHKPLVFGIDAGRSQHRSNAALAHWTYISEIHAHGSSVV